jgi:hypothetical protein
VTFATGFEQIKQVTAHQVSRMLSALTRLIGREAARERITAATGRAHTRLLADDDVEEEAETGPETEPKTGLYTEPEQNHNTNTAATATASASIESDESSSSNNSESDLPTADAGVTRPLSASDLLSNEWLVHEIMVSSDEHIQVSTQFSLCYMLQCL